MRVVNLLVQLNLFVQSNTKDSFLKGLVLYSGPLVHCFISSYTPWIIRALWDIIIFILKLSVPPILIYISSDAQLSPPSFGIFKSKSWYGKFVFILVLLLRSVYQIKRRAMLCAIDSLRRSSCAGQFSTRAILSHTMTWNRQVEAGYYDWTLASRGFLR